MIYENEIGEIRYHMNACHTCIHQDTGCTTTISQMTHKGNFMICPNFRPIQLDEMIDRFYDNVTEDDIKEYMTGRIDNGKKKED